MASAAVGVGAGIAPTSAGMGKSKNWAVWQFGGGESGKNLC